MREVAVVVGLRCRVADDEDNVKYRRRRRGIKGVYRPCALPFPFPSSRAPVLGSIYYVASGITDVLKLPVI